MKVEKLKGIEKKIFDLRNDAMLELENIIIKLLEKQKKLLKLENKK